MEVYIMLYGICYTLYNLLSATDQIHLNVVCSGEQIVQHIANTIYFYVITALGGCFPCWSESEVKKKIQSTDLYFDH